MSALPDTRLHTAAHGAPMRSAQTHVHSAHVLLRRAPISTACSGRQAVRSAQASFATELARTLATPRSGKFEIDSY